MLENIPFRGLGLKKKSPSLSLSLSLSLSRSRSLALALSPSSPIPPHSLPLQQTSVHVADEDVVEPQVDDVDRFVENAEESAGGSADVDAQFRHELGITQRRQRTTMKEGPVLVEDANVGLREGGRVW